MFTGFFYFLREKGMDIGLSEWLSLVEAMDKGLIHADFTQFYLVSRMILVKNEYEFDKYDMIFEEYFKGIKHEFDDISEQMRKWLEKPEYNAFREDLEKKKAMMEEEGIEIKEAEDLEEDLTESITEDVEDFDDGTVDLGEEF